jgi:hypothetical protein
MRAWSEVIKDLVKAERARANEPAARGGGCPRCGCDHAAVREYMGTGGAWFSQSQRSAEERERWKCTCRHCGTVYFVTAVAEAAVESPQETERNAEAGRDEGKRWERAVCPHCHAAAGRVTSTRKEFRRLKCEACGKGFKVGRG